MPDALRGIITDWGGVLTAPLGPTIESWLAADRIDRDHYAAVMREWFAGLRTTPEGDNAIHALERGEIPVPEFERLLAAELRREDGAPVPADGLISRMFSSFHPVDEMYEVMRRARGQGVRTALLSNSWGNGYPRDRFAEAFDAVVISGEVGMRKPEPEIFLLAAEQSGLEPRECVFIDDLEHNVAAAMEVGMIGILHTDPAITRSLLAEAFGAELEPAGA